MTSAAPHRESIKKTAAGGVYRLSRKDQSTRQDSPHQKAADSFDPANATPAQLVSHLNDAQPWIARHALIELAKLNGDAASEAITSLTQQLTSDATPLTQRLNAAWGLCAIGNDSALKQLTSMVTSNNSSIAQVACHALSLHRFKPAKHQLEAAVTAAGLSVRRAAAEALGRVGNAESVTALMKGISFDSFDRALQHSITYALIELEAVDAIEHFAMSSSTPQQQQAAMIALDQLGASERLSVDFMLAAIDSTDSHCAQATASLLAKHPEWASRFVKTITERIAKDNTGDAMPDSMRTIVSGWKDTEAVQKWVASLLAEAPSKPTTRQSQITSILAMYSVSSLPQSWDPSIAQWLDKAQPQVRSQVIAVLTQMDLSKASQTIASLQRFAKESKSVVAQLEIISALPVGSQMNDDKIENAILAAPPFKRHRHSSSRFCGTSESQAQPNEQQQSTRQIARTTASILGYFD